MIATSELEAPVAILRVYCSCPGVSATINLHFDVSKKRYATSIVIPCSRSACKPSINKARSISFPWVPYFSLSILT